MNWLGSNYSCIAITACVLLCLCCLLSVYFKGKMKGEDCIFSLGAAFFLTLISGPRKRGGSRFVMI